MKILFVASVFTALILSDQNKLIGIDSEWAFIYIWRKMPPIRELTKTNLLIYVVITTGKGFLLCISWKFKIPVCKIISCIPDSSQKNLFHLTQLWTTFIWLAENKIVLLLHPQSQRNI